jgi:hypothetical protein
LGGGHRVSCGHERRTNGKVRNTRGTASQFSSRYHSFNKRGLRRPGASGDRGKAQRWFRSTTRQVLMSVQPRRGAGISRKRGTCELPRRPSDQPNSSRPAHGSPTTHIRWGVFAERGGRLGPLLRKDFSTRIKVNKSTNISSAGPWVLWLDTQASPRALLYTTVRAGKHRQNLQQ